ncbi:MAG: O-antigen ligase family protein [Bacteroidales bacterium]|nr:O-antigen ligase family protein [Bacteroidales bacterium]
MQLLKKYSTYSNQIYFWLLTLLIVSLPFSPFMVSLSQILLLLNWILEGNFHQKWFRLKHRRSIWIFVSFYLIHLIWLIGTEDWNEAAETLRIKLPLLILPIIIGTSEDLSPKKVMIILRWFIIGLIAATFVSLGTYWGWWGKPIHDIRQITPFISHIRFSLLMVVAIFTLMHWIKTSENVLKRMQLLHIVAIVWFVLFLFFMKALTGVVILAITLFLLLLFFVNRIENQLLKIFFIAVMYAVPFFSVITIVKVYYQYHRENTIALDSLPRYTANGNEYIHNLSHWEVENGHKVWLFVCETELRKEWNKRSKIPYDSLDRKGQPIKSTLIRYMTSLGLPKDSAGVVRLKGKDIVNIENGLTNVIFANKYSIVPRIYEVIWEIDHYKHTGAVDNHSVIQRLVFYQIALYLIKNHFFFGVGTGDLPKEYRQYYETHPTGISPERWWETHNQYLRVFATFGIIGFIIFLAAFILPPFFERKWQSYYFLMVFIVIMLSFINEDTLDTQAGVTFTAFFYSLFLWGASRKLA